MATERHVDRARIYVSFADEDRGRAMEVVRWLNDSGWSVVADDRHAFMADDKWSPPPRLDACDVVLCVITPGWLVSGFCYREYTYCAKRGKFVLPVICEPFDLDLLPDPLRALPRVDLTSNRLVDYLALKETLTQTGTPVSRAAAATGEEPAPRPKSRWALLDDRRTRAIVAGTLLVVVVAVVAWLVPWR
jgi:hypothetical protein